MISTGSFKTDSIFSSGIITAYVLILAALLGAVMASFLTCLAARTVTKESIFRGRSHCDVCGHVLGPLDLIPIFSFLFLKGKCRYCHHKIPARSFITEILSAVVFLMIILRFGLGFDALRAAILYCILLPLSLIDLDSFTIPDRYILSGIAVWILFLPLIHNPWKDTLMSGLLGGFIIGAGVLVVALIMDRILGRESMGGGDIKLLFVMGLYLGPAGGMLALILACLLGLLFIAAVRKKKIPFGPSISAAFMIVLLFGEPVISWYLSLIGI
ncbi:MAG: prepilin peptidase [Lachnospiraceae bacterium]|jgi:leader peptidase (prepilin peptidase)/N-methyltransferase|nr:prepilin peptidase [Lachnospiraceae bacterium]MCH4029243.1 prepilin peptidase [Lachnospiraceae bacterium]MCH4067905.1 prepilin peptidase [Lachnospiraceae bacterium]MCH4113930.1 prepilin peptidase [Lachnospiraceae bacterium]MCI1353823.1 prepilin peptidase [Lachnospiraceae bacterium]